MELKNFRYSRNGLEDDIGEEVVCLSRNGQAQIMGRDRKESRRHGTWKQGDRYKWAGIMYSHLPYFVRLVCGPLERIRRPGWAEKWRRSILVRSTSQGEGRGDKDAPSDSRSHRWSTTTISSLNDFARARLSLRPPRIENLTFSNSSNVVSCYKSSWRRRRFERIDQIRDADYENLAYFFV